MIKVNPEWQSIPTHDLVAQSPVPLTILPDLDALFQHFARALADEIAANNQSGRPTRLILPVDRSANFLCSPHSAMGKP